MTSDHDTTLLQRGGTRVVVDRVGTVVRPPLVGGVGTWAAATRKLAH